MSHRWTWPEIREARRRQAAGETVAQIAASYGVTLRALKSALVRYSPDDGPGKGHGKARGVSPELEKLYRRAWLMRRKEGWGWPRIAEEVGWQGHYKDLGQRVLRYARRLGAKDAARKVPPLVVGPHAPGVCRIEECERPSWVRGLCGACHKRARKYGRLDDLALPPKR